MADKKNKMGVYEKILEEHSLEELASAVDNKKADKTHPKPEGSSRFLLENTLIRLYRGPAYKSWVSAKTGKPLNVECVGTEPINIHHSYSKEMGDQLTEEEIKKQAVKYQANAYALSLNESSVHGDRVLSVVFFKINLSQEDDL